MRIKRRSSLPFVPLVLCLFVLNVAAQWAPRNPVRQVQSQPDGVLFTMLTGTLKLKVCTDSIIRVLYSPTATFPDRPDYVVTRKAWLTPRWTKQSTEDDVTISTSRLNVVVSRKDGSITY